MKLPLRHACGLLAAFLGTVTPLAAVTTSGTCQNPIIAGNPADPAVLRHDGVYYLYATGEVLRLGRSLALPRGDFVESRSGAMA